tara:strand:+ start:16291 stop:16968 length:678 start_codon:yes stop_codon:yes gene_type:complete
MAGIEAGKTWSRIGAEVAPTDSAASGVWGDLNEVAENVGAGTWPAPLNIEYQFIAKFVADGTTVTYDFTSISQDYRDLRLVISAARNSGSQEQMNIFVDIGSGFDTVDANYGTRFLNSDTGTYGSMSVITGATPRMTDDFPANDTWSSCAILDFKDYADASKFSCWNHWQLPGGTSNYSEHTYGGMLHNVTGAVSGIRVQQRLLTSGYYWKSPSTFALFGLGAAD